MDSVKQRDPELSAIVADAIEQQDEEHKQEKKRKREGGTAGEKRVRFNNEELADVREFSAEPEPAQQQEDDGPIKEHLLQVVYEKRQKHNDGLSAEQTTDMQFDTEGDYMEKDAEYADLDGEEVSAFNMNEEREEGYDVETGELRRKKTDEEELANDPFLQSLQEEERKQQKLQRETGMRAHSTAAAAAAAAQRQQAEAQPLTDAELSRARALLIQHMQPRESVMQALARISGKLKPSAVRARDRVGSKRYSEAEQGQASLVNMLTDAATSLLSDDGDAFELRREELEHALRISSISAPQAQRPGALEDGNQSDDDLFADSDDEKAGAAPPPQTSGTEPNPAQPQPVSAAAAEQQSAPDTANAGDSGAAAAEQSAGAVNGTSTAMVQDTAAAGASAAQYDTWPVSELKRALYEANVSFEGATEKADLIEKMVALDQSRAASTVPMGFVLEPSSGYYVHPDTGWYYHVDTRSYYHSGKWYVMDGAGQLQACA